MFINRCFINYFIVVTVLKCLLFAPYSSSLTINNSFKSLIMSIMNCRRQLNWGLRWTSTEEDCHASRDRDNCHLRRDLQKWRISNFSAGFTDKHSHCGSFKSLGIRNYSLRSRFCFFLEDSDIEFVILYYHTIHLVHVSFGKSPTTRAL